MFSCVSADQADISGPSSCSCCQPQLQAVARRIDRDLSRRGFIAGAGASLASLGFTRPAGAQPAPPRPTPPIVFANFRLFDGRSKVLRGGLRLLVEGNRIKPIASGDPPPPDGARMIDCGGRVLMPGLIDAHWHALFAALPVATLLTADIGYIYLAASAEAERTLMRGFTTVRDLGGPSFAFKQAIDEGLIAGPAHLSVRRHDHGDRRPRRPASSVRSAEESGRPAELHGADRAPPIRRQRRRDPAAGARAAHAGRFADQARGRRRRRIAAQPAGPDDAQRARAARGVEAARDRNTYVAVHAYPPKRSSGRSLQAPSASSTGI